MLGGFAAIVLGIVLLVRRFPYPAAIGFLLVIAFVPIWVEVPLPFIRPSFASAVAGLLAIGLALRTSHIRLTLPDLLAGFLLISATVPMALGLLSLNSFLGVLVIWGTAFVVGRLILLHVDQGKLYATIAVIFGVVAVLAIVEFLTDWHGLASWGPANSSRATWAPIQIRSGLSRAEGAFGHSIALGTTLAMAAVLTLDAKLPRVTRLILIAVMIGAIGVTLSRGALICLFLGLVLALFFLPHPRVHELRVALAAVLVSAVVIGAPIVLGVFTGAGAEARDSAEYRGDLTNLTSSIEWIGRSPAFQSSADGTLYVGGFKSIDNQFLIFGLSFGWLTVAMVVCLLAFAAYAVLSGRGTPPTVAMLAQVPALLTVALITQYAVFFWFMFGLAAGAEQLRTRDRRTPKLIGRAYPIAAQTAFRTPTAR